MSRRSVGVGFIIASSLFIGANLLSNSLLMSGTEDYELLKRLSAEFISNIGVILGLISFVIGVAYLVIAETIKNSKEKD